MRDIKSCLDYDDLLLNKLKIEAIVFRSLRHPLAFYVVHNLMYVGHPYHNNRLFVG